jgi:hypothetical protein
MLESEVRSPRLADDIALGAQLAKMQNRPIGPEDVARVLRLAGVEFVLVGAHAANGYTGRPRATVDVDVIPKFPKKAVEAISAAFPQLAVHDTPVVTRFKDGTLEAIDVMKPNASKLWGRLLKETRGVKVGAETILVPVVEGVLAAKFSAMSSPTRGRGDKMIDGGDFIHIVEANPAINLELLRDLGELVFPGGGAFVVRLIGDVRAGRKLEI